MSSFKHKPLKKIFFVALMVISTLSAFSQTDSLPPHLKNPEIPDFSIMKVMDSVAFSRENLVKNERTIFMIFNPDCGHCQHFVKELIDSIGFFKKTQIVMVSSVDFSHIKKFYEDYKISKVPFITMGRDANYSLNNFFSTRQFPSLYIYNNKGKYVKSFAGGGPIKEIAAAE